VAPRVVRQVAPPVVHREQVRGSQSSEGVNPQDPGGRRNLPGLCRGQWTGERWPQRLCRLRGSQVSEEHAVSE
jgi:hypothetical protein